MAGCTGLVHMAGCTGLAHMAWCTCMWLGALAHKDISFRRTCYNYWRVVAVVAGCGWGGSNMFMCTFDEALVARARVRAEEMGTLPNSFGHGGGAVVGFIGEMCVKQCLTDSGVASMIYDSLDYDIVAGPYDVKLEVKTMQVKAPPQPAYLNPVLARSKLQKADLYMFVRVMFKDALDLEKGGTAFFCGSLPCHLITIAGRLLKQGDISNGFPVRQDCWNAAIGDCCPWDRTVCHIQTAHPHAHPHAQPQPHAQAWPAMGEVRPIEQKAQHVAEEVRPVDKKAQHADDKAQPMVQAAQIPGCRCRWGLACYACCSQALE